MEKREGDTPLRVELLGPLRVLLGAAPVEVPGPRRRALLAVLALAAPRVVSAHALVDTLWPDGPPDGGQQALHTQISRLRRTLGPASARLQRVPPGYRLELGPGELDVAEAEDLARRTAAELGRHGDRAAGLARQALALWRGRALEEFADQDALAARAVQLDELHRQLRGQLVAARIEAGDLGATADAAALAADDPLGEPATLLWVRALAAVGRTAEAMHAAADFRRRLAEETGLDPSGQLAALEQRVAGGLASAPPPPRLAVRRNVARPRGPLEGRDQDRAELIRLLRTQPVVTVTGPGGVGKTRLALDVAAEPDEDRGGVVLVALAAVTDPRRVPEAVASALGVRTEGPPTVTSIAEVLSGQELLLVLDNCEHVVAACRDLVIGLQTRAPQVRVLATSRAGLHVPGEYVLRLQPLPVPTTGLSYERLLRQPSVRAFVEHAVRRDSRFTLPAADCADVVEVIRRLDGLPLGIELAAGQLAVLPVRALREKLDRALDVLTGVRSDDEARQRTLRATVDWSYELLGDPERRLLSALAPFPGGADLETVERLAADVAPSHDPVVVLGRLIDASLVVRDPTGRYGLLETVRHTLLSRLTAEHGRTAAEDRFLAWADDTARELAAGLSSADEPAADRRLRRELANLRAARDLARARADIDRLVTMTLAVDEASTWRGIAELWTWPSELVAEPLIAGRADEAVIYGAAANAAWLQGDLDGAERLARRGLEIAADDLCAASRSWSALATVGLFRADFSTALDDFLRSAAGDRRPTANLAVAALLAVYAGQPERAEELLRRTHDELRSWPCVSHRSFAEYVAGEAASSAGHLDRAIDSYRAAIESAREAGVQFVEGVATVGLASALARSGDVAGASRHFAQLLGYWLTTGNQVQLWTTLRNVADLLADTGRPVDAARLLLAAGAAPGAASVDADTAQRAADVLATAQSRLSRDDWATLLQTSTALGPGSAVRLAEESLSRLLSDS